MPGFEMDGMQRLEQEVNAIRLVSQEAKSTAALALAGLSAHEKICDLRYQNISTKLDSITKIYEKLDSLSRILNVGIGVWMGTLAVGTVLGIVYTVVKFGAPG